MSQYLNDLIDFLDSGHSPFHSVDSARKRLGAAGFISLDECGQWTVEPGGSYYTTRNQSSIIAFKVPNEHLSCWRITASHSDSPTYRIKLETQPDKSSSGITRVWVEGYGGMIAGSWMDRPLTAAGRVLVSSGDTVESRLVYLDRDFLVIPSLAIHMDRSMNESRELNTSRDMQPLLGEEGCLPMAKLLAQYLGIDAENILSADLTLCPRQHPVLLGADEEFICSPRLDDLECAWGTLSAFLSTVPPRGVASAWCMFDNEEVGSGTRQGADGSFLPDVMARVEAAMGLSPDQHCSAIAGSLLLSADNAHAIHPNYGDKSDPSSPVKLNGGVVLKYSASQKYTTTALTGALFTRLCKKAGVPLQVYANRPDMPGGSTLGHILSAQVSVPMMDIGLPQLSMHACVETAGSKDPEYLLRACEAFYCSTITCTADGAYIVR